MALRLKRLRMDKNCNAGKVVGFGDYGGYGCFSITVAVPARAVTIAEMTKGGGKGENGGKDENG